ncbi:MAG: hypothetical protein MUE81_18595 [Thermoflexibacter sp.]|jgi:FtsH-binding integral membrane protein|nr:hypothetical protein [Thermoflexibacter sp.]
MKPKFQLLSSHESYLLGGLSAIIGIALLPLILGFSLSFEFAISYWTVVIIVAIIMASLILLRQSREIKKSETQIKMYEEMVNNIKKTNK